MPLYAYTNHNRKLYMQKSRGEKLLTSYSYRCQVLRVKFLAHVQPRRVRSVVCTLSVPG